jgi:hypothetical protein
MIDFEALNEYKNINISLIVSILVNFYNYLIIPTSFSNCNI